ncbi:MAG: fumarate reductase subunit D [Acidobacteria bacterium]|nr:fumarate reductase subunit D [Acidobacteriota bacterium]
MVRQHSEPYLWLLFSAGGVLSAMLMPSLLLLFGIAFPLGWVRPPTHERMLAVLANPLTRLVFLGLCVLSLVHWAHRFRHTLHDGLRLAHPMITALCYGAAVAGSALAAYLLWQVA